MIVWSFVRTGLSGSISMEQFIKHIEIKGLTGPTNPGTATWAFVVITTISTEYYHQAGYIGENITNNAAELRAFIEALRYIELKGWKGFVVKTGLVTLIQQLSRARSVVDNQSPFLAEARYLLKQTRCSVEWRAESRNNYATDYARKLYFKARRGELVPSPMVMLKLVEGYYSADEDEPGQQLQLPLFG